MPPTPYILGDRNGRKKEIFIWLLFLAALIGVLSLIMSRPRSWYVPEMMEMVGMMGFGWGLMFLVPLVFLVLIAVGAYYIITELAGTSRSASSHSDGALEILKERYAKGEIGREEYLKMKAELES